MLAQQWDDDRVQVPSVIERGDEMAVGHTHRHSMIDVRDGVAHVVTSVDYRWTPHRRSVGFLTGVSEHHRQQKTCHDRSITSSRAEIDKR